MPWSDWDQADGMSLLMSSARIERDRLGVGRAGARVDRAVPIAAASVCAVFACFFAIGRAMDTRGASRAEAPSSLPTASVRAAIPVRLSDAAPIEIPSAAPAAAGVRPRRPSAPLPASTRVASAPARASSPVRAAATEAPSASREAPRAAPPPSQPAPSVSPAREPAPSSPAGGAPASSKRSSGSGGGHSTPSTRSGGSFDTSG